MPIYEYQCLHCGKISAHLILPKEELVPFCKHCGSKKVKRIISRVNVLRSTETKIEQFTDPTRWGDLENNPRAFANWMKEVGKEFGEDFTSEEMEKMVEETIKETYEPEEAKR
jgi:putative FmdB family regulatory protein